MRSSGSTPSRSARRAPRLLLWFAGDDDPRVCTGARLVRFGRAHRVPDPTRLTPPPIVLDPYAPLPLSHRDVAAARRGGILVVDCSWNRLSHAGRFPGATPHGRRNPLARRLPFLLAANPQHYGRVGELNTAEALSAALYVLGFPAAAASVLEGFRGGEAFLEINRHALDRFRTAASPRDVEEAERAVYGGPAVDPTNSASSS
jgi:pre-rRNA-processing protein TSR3